MNKLLSMIRGLIGFLGELMIMVGVLLAIAGYFAKTTPGLLLGLGLALVFSVQVGFDKIACAIKDKK